MNLKQTDIERRVTEAVIEEFCDNGDNAPVYTWKMFENQFVINDEYRPVIFINPGFKNYSRAEKGYCDTLGELESTYLSRIKRMGKWIGGFDY